MSLSQGYKSFHGRAPRSASRYDFHIPKGLVILGRAVSVEYECDKLNGGGDGKKAIYHHKFKRGVVLCMDERRKRQLYIIGKDLIVTDRGIEN